MRFHFRYWLIVLTVLTVISVAWRRVDYRVRQLQPWRLLHAGPTTAENGLLLDYIGPSTPLNLWNALRHQHHPVILSIVGDTLLKVLTIASTSVLVLQSVTVQYSDWPMTSSTNFSVFPTNVPPMWDSSLLFQALMTLPQINASFPAWTGNGYTVQSIESDRDLPSRSIITASVEAFRAEFNGCETGFDTWLGKERNISALQRLTSSCQANYSWYDSGLTGLWGAILLNDDCERINQSQPILTILVNTSTDEQWPSSAVWTNCWWNAGIVPTTVTLQGDASAGSSLYNITTSMAPLSAGRPLVDNERLSIDVYGNLVWTLHEIANPSENFPISVPLLPFLNWLYPEASDAELFSGEKIANATNYIFSNTAAMIVKVGSTSNVSEPLNGTMETIEQRVLVLERSVRIMECALAVLLAVTLLLATRVRQRIVPCDPGSIAALSSILAGSVDIVSLLKNRGHCSAKEISAHLVPCHYQTCELRLPSEQQSFMICAYHRLEYSQQNSMPTKAEIHATTRWRPLGLCPTMIAASVLTPLVLIMALELTLRHSWRENGVASVDVNSWEQNIWQFLPALTMVLVGLLFSCVGYAVRILQQFLALRESEHAAQIAMFDSPMRKNAASLLWMSARRRNAALAAASIAALIAPFQPIVVSGLFAAVNHPSQASTIIYATDHFDTHFDNWTRGSDIADFTATTLQAYANLAWPMWTYDSLILPHVELRPADINVDVSKVTQLSLKLPALRSTLTCHHTAAEQSIGAELSFSIWLDNGTLFTIPMGNNTGEGYLIGSYYPSCHAGFQECDDTGPFLLAYFAKIDPAFPNSENNITALICDWPIIEQVQTMVTFQLPEYKINSSIPPVPDESTITVFSNHSFLVDRIGGAGHGYFLAGLFSQGPWEPPFETDKSFAAPNDGLLSAALDNRISTSIHLDAFFDPNILKTQVEYAYSFLVGQYIHQLLRVSNSAATNKANNMTFEGIYTVRDSMRLLQSTTSTRILQGLLGVLLICALVIHTTITREGRNLLPKDPSSIAGMASLLAGSKLVTRELVPEGSEWLGDAELQRAGILCGEDMDFGIGWWDCEDDEHEEEDRSDGEARRVSDDEPSISAQGKPRRRFGIDVARPHWRKAMKPGWDL